MEFFTSSSFFNASAAVIFLHLLLSLAPLWNDWLHWQLVGHVPLNWSKALSKNSVYKSSRSGRSHWKDSRGFGFGLEMQVIYFLWTCKNYNMDENILEKLDNELHVKVKKCVKQKHPCVF